MFTSKEPRKIYKISDLAKELDRCPLTIKRWEVRGLIPKAKRDSRGWRYYNDDDVKKLIKVIKESNYFINVSEH